MVRPREGPDSLGICARQAKLSKSCHVIKLVWADYGLTSPVVSADTYILVGLRYTYAMTYLKSIRGFDPMHSWLGAFVVTEAQR